MTKTSTPLRIRYLQAYGSVFDGPNGWSNLLWGTLCAMIPIVGQIVMSGYYFEVIELNSRTPGTPNPKFTFDRFSIYLTRGAWPFVIQIIVQFTLQPVLTVVWEAGLFGIIFGGQAAGKELAPILIGVGIAAWSFLGLGISICLALLICPLILRAGLSQDFMKAFNFRWVVDFNRRVWLEAVLAILFMVCTVPFLIACGYALCFIGLIPMSTIIMLAATNLWWQLYNLYLARGGQPIPLKPVPKSPPPPSEPLIAAPVTAA